MASTKLGQRSVTRTTRETVAIILFQTSHCLQIGAMLVPFFSVMSGKKESQYHFLFANVQNITFFFKTSILNHKNAERTQKFAWMPKMDYLLNEEINILHVYVFKFASSYGISLSISNIFIKLTAKHWGVYRISKDKTPRVYFRNLQKYLRQPDSTLPRHFFSFCSHFINICVRAGVLLFLFYCCCFVYSTRENKNSLFNFTFTLTFFLLNTCIAENI